MKKQRKAAKRFLSQITPSAKALASKIYNAIRSNKLATVQTVLLIHLVIRVEQLHTLFYALTGAIYESVILIAFSVHNAQVQFGAAIQSILSLFNGQGS